MQITADILGRQIRREAARFEGLREVRPNANWDDPATPGPDAALVQELRDAMRPSPWEPGWAYCAAFAEGCIRIALARLGVPAKDAARFLDRMSPHVMTTVNVFDELGLLSKTPEPGGVWLAQHGKSSNGHEGIVQACERNGVFMRVVTTEGNTSLDPGNDAKEREGDWITHRIQTEGGRGSLVTRGYINPPAILSLIGV